MKRLNLKTSLVALPLAAAALLGTAALPAHAADTPADQVVVKAAEAPTPAVSIHLDDGANGVQVADAISNIREKNRGEFVRKAVDAAFEKSGGRYSVMIMNLSQGYSEQLQGKRLYGNIQYGSIHYGLWIAESGRFTNTGDGGYDNWGFRGWFNRDGKTVDFHRP